MRMQVDSVERKTQMHTMRHYLKPIVSNPSMRKLQSTMLKALDLVISSLRITTKILELWILRAVPWTTMSCNETASTYE
jgi:hypothetical protein